MTHFNESRTARWHSPTVGTAVLWAAVILASALVLSGTEYLAHLLPILAGAAFVNLLVVERAA